MSMRARFGKFVTSLNNSIINFIASLFSIRQYQQLPLAWCGFSASRLLSWMERSAQLTACHKQALRLSSSCLGLSTNPNCLPLSCTFFAYSTFLLTVINATRCQLVSETYKAANNIFKTHMYYIQAFWSFQVDCNPNL